MFTGRKTSDVYRFTCNAVHAYITLSFLGCTFPEYYTFPRKGTSHSQHVLCGCIRPGYLPKGVHRYTLYAVHVYSICNTCTCI